MLETSDEDGYKAYDGTKTILGSEVPNTSSTSTYILLKGNMSSLKTTFLLTKNVPDSRLKSL